MKVILLKDVKNVGKKDQIINAADGSKLNDTSELDVQLINNKNKYKISIF